jgi:undecaprenyl diphosphate synthase
MAFDPQKLPQHVAIIMDGNRRWAKQHGWNPIEGHRYVTDKVIQPLVEHCGDLGIKYLTLWAFSTENWERDKLELEALMKLFRYGLSSKADELIAMGAQIRVLGELDRFPKDIAQTSRDLMEKSKHNDKIILTFALNYGGRDEMVRAFNLFLKENPDKTEIDEAAFAKYLDTAGMPDPDLIIRPGGQLRLSFSDVLMPDFTPAELDRALEDYQSRQRRFGR